MKDWAQAMRQWWLWLFGERTMPDKRSRVMLAATGVVVVLVVVGLAVVLRSPASTTNASSAGSSNSSQVPSVNLNSQLDSGTGSSGSDDSDGGTSGGATANHGTIPRGTPKGSHSRTERSGSKTKGTTGATTKKPTTTTTTTTAPAPHGPVVASVQPFTNSADDPAGTSNLPDLVPGLDPTAPAPSVVAVPGAPTVIKISGHGSPRVTWSAPSNQGTSPITGYDLYVGTVSGGEYAEPVNGPLPITGTSYLVSNLTVGTTYYFTVKAINAVGLSAPSNEMSATPGNSYRSVGTLATPVVSMAANPQGTGYWLANSGGAVATHGTVSSYGSTAGLHLNAPIEQIVATSDGKGYWEVASDGGIFAFGDAGFDGSMGGVPLDHQVVGMALDPVSGGYWEVASDGGVFAFGGAPFLGSPTSLELANPVVGIAAAANGEGYWEVASDGGIFSYGSAAFQGSTGALDLNAPVAGMAVDQGTGGYWLFSLDGGIFAIGAPFHGAG